MEKRSGKFTAGECQIRHISRNNIKQTLLICKLALLSQKRKKKRKKNIKD